MKLFAVTIDNPVGLHARPAAIIVQTAGTFMSDIAVIKDDRRANAKSILAVLSLGAAQNSRIVFEISGSDENEAWTTLQETVATQLGPVTPSSHAAGGQSS